MVTPGGTGDAPPLRLVLRSGPPARLDTFSPSFRALATMVWNALDELGVPDGSGVSGDLEEAMNEAGMLPGTPLRRFAWVQERLHTLQLRAEACQLDRCDHRELRRLLLAEPPLRLLSELDGFPGLTDGIPQVVDLPDGEVTSADQTAAQLALHLRHLRGALRTWAANEGMSRTL